MWLQVAQKRLRKYPNVEFCLGDIDTLNLPSASFDVVFLHFVLHDIEAQDRPRIARGLARTLADQGKLCVREPLRFISQDEIRQLLQQNGLVETAMRISKVPTQGQAYEGVWRKASSPLQG